MQVTPQLIFHSIDRSAWIEDYLMERVQKLDRPAGGITSCRVTLKREQAPFRRTAARRKAIKDSEIAKIRDEGDARNAARKMGLPAPPRKRKTEPIARKPEAKPKASISSQGEPHSVND